MQHRNAEVSYWVSGMEESWIKWKLFNGMREMENVNLLKRNSCMEGVKM